MSRTGKKKPHSRIPGDEAALVSAVRPRRSTRTRSESDAHDTNIQILDGAAQCFMEMGFQGTSIDDVARRLNATKGLIYHYYASKTDLFFDVHREGMRRLNEAVEAAASGGGNGRETLQAMLEAHALTMLQNIAYLAVVVQGVHMHRLGATTLAQRAVLDELMEIRKNFEKMFLAAMKRGEEDGSIRVANAAIAVKSMLGAINWTAIWYRPRPHESRAQQRAIAAQIAHIQIHGVCPPD